MAEDINRKVRKQLEIITGPAGRTGGLAMQDALRELDRLVKERGTELVPPVRHFLANRSYQKALDYLNQKKG